MVVNITFLSFLQFLMSQSIHDAVNTWINCSFFYIIRVIGAVCIYSEPSPVLAVMPKENIGYGAAFGYYYGYLHLVLPGN